MLPLLLFLTTLSLTLSEQIYSDCFETDIFPEFCLIVNSAPETCASWTASVNVGGSTVKDFDISFFEAVEYLHDFHQDFVSADDPVYECQSVKVSMLTLEICLNISKFEYDHEAQILEGCGSLVVPLADIVIDLGCIDVPGCSLLGCQDDWCSGKGECTSFGLCQCDDGYTGIYCELEEVNEHCFSSTRGPCIDVSSQDNCESYDVRFSMRDGELLNSKEDRLIAGDCVQYSDTCQQCSTFYFKENNLVCGEYVLGCDSEEGTESYEICKEVDKLFSCSVESETISSSSETLSSTSSESTSPENIRTVLVSQCFKDIPYCISSYEDTCLFLGFQVSRELNGPAIHDEEVATLDILNSAVHSSDGKTTICSPIEIDNHQDCSICREITESAVDPNKNLHLCLSSDIECGGKIIDEIDLGCITIDGCDFLSCKEYSCNLRGECTASGICLCEDFYHDPYCQLKQSGRCISSSYLGGSLCIDALFTECDKIDISVAFESKTVKSETYSIKNLESTSFQMYECQSLSIFPGCVICPHTNFSVCDNQVFSQIYLDVNCLGKTITSFPIDEISITESTTLLCNGPTRSCTPSIEPEPTQPTISKFPTIPILIISTVLLLIFFFILLIIRKTRRPPTYLPANPLNLSSLTYSSSD